MPLLQWRGETIVPQRRTEDFGESDWSDIAPIDDAVFTFDTPAVDITSSGGRDVQTGSLFVPRGADLKDGDRVPYRGKWFGVVGGVRWDMDHPFTGADFGVVEYTIRLGG